MKITGLNGDQISELENLVSHNITFINEALITEEVFLDAQNLTKHIDINDTAFVALTMHLGGKLWTGDNHLYNGLKTSGFDNILNIADISLLIDNLENV